MTVHDLLVKKARAYAYAIFFLALAMVAVHLFAPASALLQLQLVLACFGGTLLVLAVMAVRFRCPTCNGSLAPLVAHFGPLRRFGRKVQCCPFCTTSLGNSAGA